MSITLEISTKNYSENRLAIKIALSHMETLVGSVNGYSLSEPSTKFGWTFFKIAIKPELQNQIEKKFEDMLEKYSVKGQSEKFTNLLTDYFESKNCNVKVKLTNS